MVESKLPAAVKMVLHRRTDAWTVRRPGRGYRGQVDEN
jgi:hypothetical protein